jgi:transcription elongation factor GreA
MIENTIQNLKADLAAAVARRRELQEAFNDAAELGDAPENFPLDAARRALHTNEDLITQLESKIAAIQGGQIEEVKEYLVQDQEGQKMKIVLTFETVSVQADVRVISPESPLGKALLETKGVGEFEYILPNGTVKKMVRLQ